MLRLILRLSRFLLITKTWKKTDDGQTIISKLNAADVFLLHLGKWSNEIVLRKVFKDWVETESMIRNIVSDIFLKQWALKTHSKIFRNIICANKMRFPYLKKDMQGNMVHAHSDSIKRRWASKMDA